MGNSVARESYLDNRCMRDGVIMCVDRGRYLGANHYSRRADAMTKGSRPQGSIVDGNHRGAGAGFMRKEKKPERSFAPVTAESMRQRMAIRTNRQLQVVMARIGKAAKNNCGRIRCEPCALSAESRAFLVDELGYSVAYIDEKDKYEVRWSGSEETDEAPDINIDSEFAEG